MPPKIARVLGPYRNGTKWRLVVFDEKGQRMARLAESRQEADALKAQLCELFGNRASITVEAAIDEWTAEKRLQGIKDVSLRATRDVVRRFLPLDATLGEITPAAAAELYLAQTRRIGKYGVLSACTHQKSLLAVKSLFAWAIEREYIAENPFRKVRPLGKAKSGKKQLREDEARKLYHHALGCATAGDRAALALVVQLVMGLRSAEVLGLRVRDLDAGATLLVIEGTKTKNARRTLRIESQALRALLIAECAKRAADDLIFQTEQGKRHLTPYLHKALRRLCLAAAVPVVCPHSLRGLHSSLAVAHGESSRAVAQALGHGSDQVTKKHYIAADALDASSARRVVTALESTEDEALAKALSSLSPERLRALLHSVAERTRSS